MRFTALCVCGTLLAFSSPSWITADSDAGVLLDLDKGFGPCTATLRPREPCRQGPHESTCPYIFSLPPITVQLPQQLRELERIVQDLEKLKDSVDELREMCADCTVSQSERACASPREHEKQKAGEDERSWMNERLQESERDYRPEGGTDRGTENTAGDRDFHQTFTLVAKEMKKQEAETERDKKVKKELNSKLTEKYGKTHTVGMYEKDRLGQTKMSYSHEDESLDYLDKGTGADRNNQKVASDKNTPYTREGSFKGYQEDKVERQQERRITTKDKTEERQYETKEMEKEIQTEPSDSIKMFEDCGTHTNREQEESVKKRTEKEKGINDKQNNDNPKQTEGTGHTGKETTIKVKELEEEVRKRGGEIITEDEKTERGQGKSDGASSSDRPNGRTDFVSFRPTPGSTISRASSPDVSGYNKARIFASSLPSPALPSSTFITDVSHQTTAAYETTESKRLGASGDSETQSPDAELDTATASMSALGGPAQPITNSPDILKSSSELKPAVDFGGDVGSSAATAAPHEKSYVTAAPNTRRNGHWQANKNITSNTKSGIKPLPGRGPNPGGKHKHELESDRKPELVVPDKKTINIQKQKPSVPKSTANQSKAGNNPKKVPVLKYDQRRQPDVFSTDQDLKNTSKPKHGRERVPGQRMPIQKAKANPKSLTPTQRHHQKHPTVNKTHLDRYPSINQMDELEEIQSSDENSEHQTKLIYPVTISRYDPNEKPEKRLESEDTASDRSFERNKDQSLAHEPELRRSETTILSPKPNQNEDSSLEPANEDSSTHRNTQNIELFNQEPTSDSHKNPIFKPASNEDSTPRGKITPDEGNTGLGQKPESAQSTPVIKPKPGTESTEKPQENVSFDSVSDPKVTPIQKHLPDRTSGSADQKFVSTQKIPTTNQKGATNITDLIEKHHYNVSHYNTAKEDSTTHQKFRPDEEIPPNNQNHNTEPVEELEKIPTIKLEDNRDSTPGQSVSSDPVNTKPDQKLKQHNNTPRVHRVFGAESGDENPTFQPKTNRKPTHGAKNIPHLIDIHTSQRLDPRRKIPELHQESETEKERSGDNVSHDPRTNKGPTPGLKTTPEPVNTGSGVVFERPNQRLKPNTPTIYQKPVTDSIEKSHNNPTFNPTFDEEPTPRPKTKSDQGSTRSDPRLTTSHKVRTAIQKQRKDFMEMAEEDSSFGSVSSSNLAPGQTPDQAQTLVDKELSTHQKPTFDKPSITESNKNTSLDSLINQESTPGNINARLDQTLKASKNISKLTQTVVTDAINKSNENPLVDASFNENASPERKVTLSQVITQPVKDVQHHAKTPTINQKLSTDSMEMPENNPHESGSNPSLAPGQKLTPGQASESENQKLQPSKPTVGQEPVTESTKKSDPNPLRETTSIEHSTLDQKMTSDHVNTRQHQKFKLKQEIVTANRKSQNESMEKLEKNTTFQPPFNRDSTPGRKITPERVNVRLDQRFKPNMKSPKLIQKPKPNQKPSKSLTDLKTRPNVSRKTDGAPQTNQQLKTPRPNFNSKPQPGEVSRAASNKTSKHPAPKRFPVRPRVRPEAAPVQRPDPAQPRPMKKTESNLDLPAVSWTTSDGIHNSQTGIPPASGPGKDIAAVSHSSKGKDLNPSMRKTVTLAPKAATGVDTGPFLNLHTLSEDSTVGLNSRSTSNLKPQTTSQTPSPSTTTTAYQSDVLSTDQVFTRPYLILESDSGSQANKLKNVEEAASTIPSPSFQITSTPSPDYRSTTSPTSGLEPSGAESSTPSARELRVKIDQVAAFFNNSPSPNGRQAVRHPKLNPGDTQGGSRPDRTETPSLIPSRVVPSVVRDCSDHLLRGHTESGVYLVTPDLRSRSFQVFCDMEREGGGWTVLQRRLDGSVSFNRSWAEYQSGFGELRWGEFWLGNNLIHLLTRERDMTLRVELQDFDGVEEHAQYALFRVASERLRYRLTVGGYSGTAGDALRFNKRYDHNNRAFTTPDRDHDRYPSGNCGAYYSSGWWFDACMAANLNGRYYEGTYKGVRDGIFWGTWHNISSEYYPTNDRQSFKTVRMMIRPKGFAP